MNVFLISAVAVVCFFLIILAIYVGGNWLIAVFRKRKAPSEESLRRYRERLLNPQWIDLQEHFGLEIPEPIKNLYAQKEMLVLRDLVFHSTNGKAWKVADFLPADIDTLRGVWPDLKKGKKFPFASDLFGDCYYIPLDHNQSGECRVMIYHHDGSDTELVSDSLDQFLKGRQVE